MGREIEVRGRYLPSHVFLQVEVERVGVERGPDGIADVSTLRRRAADNIEVMSLNSLRPTRAQQELTTYESTSSPQRHTCAQISLTQFRS